MAAGCSRRSWCLEGRRRCVGEGREVVVNWTKQGRDMRDNDWQEVGGGAVEVVVLEASSLGSGCMMAGLYSATRNMCDLARALANTDREGAGPGLAGHQPAQSQLQLQSRPAGRAGLQVSRQSGTSRWRIRWDSTHLRPTGWISCQQQRDAVCLLAD